MDEDKKEVEKTVKNELNNRFEKKLLKNTDADFIEPLGRRNIPLLIDFLKQIFIIEHSLRPNATELLRHKLFDLDLFH